MNKNEYIIINKTAIQKRIEELLKNNYRAFSEHVELDILREILSQSTPLIPEIEKAYTKAFSEGTCFGATTIYKYETSKDYISNLKLDI